MLPFNTSAFSNTLGSSDRAAQRKALVAPFKEDFDGKPDDVLQHIALFNHRCEETGVTQDFSYIEHENPVPSTVDMTNPKEKAAWLADPDRFSYGNILIDSSSVTLEKLQATRDKIRTSLQKFSTPPDPKTMPLASQQLVSFQNRQWIYALLQNVWGPTMKTIMLRYQEAHDKDGVLLWFCFLKHFAGTTVENLIEAYSLLTESKLQLSLFNDNVLDFTNAVRAPLRRLLKANEQPGFQHFLHVYHGCMDARNEEFRAFVINLYADYRAGGPAKNFSMLELLDKLDNEYNRINNLGRWTKKQDPQILALTASLESLHSKFSSLQGKYQALVAAKLPPTPSNPTPNQKLTKPPAYKAGDPEVTEFEGRTWKYCAKCFGGTWNRTHVTSEQQPGKGRSKNRKTPPTAEIETPTPTSPPPTPISPEGNAATTTDLTMDFL